MTTLSVLILSYNTKEMTLQCIASLKHALAASPDLVSEIIVIDNNSNDGSVDALRELGGITFLPLDQNLGFGKANNRGLELASGSYILYLNSDVLHVTVSYSDLIRWMEEHPKVGALSVEVALRGKPIDPASHRGFPTLWRSFCYFSPLERLFGELPLLNKIFGGYHLKDRPLNTEHEVDAVSGAYMLCRGSILRDLSGFDEKYFMYGEDLDLCYRIKDAGYSIWYYPLYRVNHIKYQSGIEGGKSPEFRRSIRRHFYDAMRIFYRSHYSHRYPWFISALVDWILGTIIKRI